MSQSPLILSFIYKRRNSSSVTDKRLSKPQGSNRVPHPQRGSRFHCRFAQQLEPERAESSRTSYSYHAWSWTGTGSKIQARVRERHVSVDVYLRELIDEKGTKSERGIGLSSQERVRLLREEA